MEFGEKDEGDRDNKIGLDEVGIGHSQCLSSFQNVGIHTQKSMLKINILYKC
jgi:hypothetical protein